MGLNTKLDDGAVGTIGVTLARLAALATNLAVDEGEFRDANFAKGVNADFIRTVSNDISLYGETLSTALAEAEDRLKARDFDAALQTLVSAHAMTMAQMVSLDIASVDNGHASLIPIGVGLGATLSDGIAAIPPPTGLQTLFGKLEKIGAWLWTVIQTLMAPGSRPTARV